MTTLDDTLNITQVPKTEYGRVSYICYNGSCTRFGLKTSVTGEGGCLFCGKSDVEKVKN